MKNLIALKREMHVHSLGSEKSSFHTGIELSRRGDSEVLMKQAAESLSQILMTAQSNSLVNVARKKNATLFTQKTQNDIGHSDLEPKKANSEIKISEEENNRISVEECNAVLKTLKFGPQSLHYVVLKKIASGGFSSVYGGYEKSSPTKSLAVKRVNVEKDETLKAQLLFEAEVLARLGANKYTIEMYDHAVVGNELFLILELGSEAFIDYLCKYQRNRSDIEHKFIRKYFRQMVRACEFIHHKDVVHCDVKGDNFIRMPNGRLKLVDFGCAALIGCMNEGVYRRRRLGTKHYMSPEYIKHSYASRALDVWSLGCILYDIIHEKTPFDSAKDVRKAIIESEPDISLVTDIDMVHILGMMFERDHHERITCRQLTQETYFSRTDEEPTVPIVRNDTKTVKISAPSIRLNEELSKI
ncbi:unnamed protein product [Bursaphelenchus okinawaensis]|uniref:Protein kinase domain-containing protein n=1 Tax=Bursaphelenchus okinawaensis TaxID=465554 RepID=A0A811KCU8_9BILA|nr:unnamed protein product [Bursaphelenchus okinawaensis]CAG9100624.1 unnamed protein product [Bursaphelenchus okinawaensis]